MTDYKFEKINEGVFFSKEKIRENTIELDNINYSTFMNHFLIDKETNDLTEEQVFSICNVRDQHPEIIGDINDRVKKVFTDFVTSGFFNEVLEVGCGRNITFSKKPTKFDYTVSDANHDVVEHNRKLGFNSILFGAKNKLEVRKKYDIAFAVFVLHFHFPDNEIISLGDHLKDKGIFFANVYRIKESSRIDLKHRFESQSFFIEKILDKSLICKDHEYWIISRSEEAAKTHILNLKEITNF